MDWRVAKKWEELSLFLFMSWREEVKRKIITWLSYHLGDPIRESRHCLVWLKLARNMVDHQFNSLLLLFQTRKLIYSLSTWWCRAERCYLYWYHVDRQHWLLEREISLVKTQHFGVFFSNQNVKETCVISQTNRNQKKILHQFLQPPDRESFKVKHKTHGRWCRERERERSKHHLTW